MPTTNRTVSAPILPADRPIVEDLIRKRANRLASVLNELDREAAADVVDGTLGAFPDCPVAFGIIIALSDAERRALIVRVLTDAEGGAA